MSDATPTLGLHLEPLGVELARHEADGVVAFAGKDRLPPAALLPRLPGEPERGDVEWPPHRRGSGFGGGETEIAGLRDAGRYPLAHAWADLAAGSTEHWRWSRSADADVTLSPARALAACLRAASPREEDRPVGLVLPEACDTFAQQALLDAAGQLGRKPLLVWRSVAAASAWLDQHADDRLPHAAGPGDEAGDLLCVHAGLDAVEVSRVRVVAVEDPEEPAGFSWVPGRSGRGHGSGLGLRPAWEAAAGAIDHAASAGSLWCRAAGIAAPGRLSTGRAWQTGLERVLSAAAAEPGGERVFGVVVTGPFAELEVDRLPLAVHAAAAIPRGPSLPACVEGRNEPVGLLAGSAAFLCDRVERGLVAWLDKLPDVRLLVRTADGEHGWARLLDEDDWVAGGRPWSRSEPLTGFSVASGAASLTLPIHHEAFETVREVKVEFEDLPTRHVAVKLEVEIRPGQGQASLRAQPEQPTGIDLLDNGVLADWAGMEDKHERPAAYVEGLPRAYPPTAARWANPRLWNDAAAQARRVTLAASPTQSEVRVLGSKLMEYPKGSGVTVAEMQTRATDSDGLPALAAARADVEAMVEKLLGLLDPMPRRGSPRGDLVDAAVRRSAMPPRRVPGSKPCWSGRSAVAPSSSPPPLGRPRASACGALKLSPNSPVPPVTRWNAARSHAWAATRWRPSPASCSTAPTPPRPCPRRTATASPG